MAGVWTETDREEDLEVISNVLTADSGGAVAAVDTTHTYKGFLVGFRVDDSGGGTAPDANWDLTLVDANGYDILNGLGTNLTGGGTDQDFYQTDLANGVAMDGLLTLSAANMGNVNVATIFLYIARYR